MAVERPKDALRFARTAWKAVGQYAAGLGAANLYTQICCAVSDYAAAAGRDVRLYLRAPAGLAAVCGPCWAGNGWRRFAPVSVGPGAPRLRWDRFGCARR